MYDFKSIEDKWRKKWEESGIYKTPEDVTPEDKYYILPQLPYPSGSGLHTGHSEVYVACDIMARYKRMKGSKVLQVLGWDSFGLPAENYAIKHNVHPKITTKENTDNFRKQIKELGISVDWDREVGSHNPDYYKWTQWFFKLFYERGLAYRKDQQVNWCDSCKTVLANDQVVNGACERCDNEIVLRQMEQWYVKITDYADRLYDDLDKVDWPSETVKRQRDWIGRSEGAEIRFEVVGSSDQNNDLIVFTTRPDTIFGATFMVVAPEHSIVNSNLENSDEIMDYVEKAKAKTELERQQQKEKTGVELKGIKAINPVNGKEIPIFVADYVLSGYGTGAIMAVPAHDERDFEFADRYNIEKKCVVFPHPSHELLDEAEKIIDDKKILFSDHKLNQIINCEIPFTDKGYSVHSDFLNGLSTTEAKEKMISYLEEKGIGIRKKTFKLRDWSVSRQRFWGAPVPMVFDPDGNPHPVQDDDLPVLLPDDVDFKPTGQSPLTYSDQFQEGVEEKYGKGWRREVDTLDTFMCSSWYYFRYLDPKNDEAFASPESLKAWMPVDFYIGGPEHVNGHLLFSRFFTKVLFDAGYIDFDEPFSKHIHQGMILGEDGRKMSKRWGNVINPTEVVDKYGADTIRMYEMFMGPLEQDKSWNDKATQGVYKFISRVYKLSKEFVQKEPGELNNDTHKTIKSVTDYTQKYRYNVAVSDFMKYLNEIEANTDNYNKSDFETFVKLLAPYAPYITEEIWEDFGHEKSIHLESWPTYDETKIVDDEIEIVIQVNGKLRGSIKIDVNISKEEILELAKQETSVSKYLSNGVKKEIYVPSKLVNFVV